MKARTDEVLGDLAYYLSLYQFTIKSASGKNNVEADSLSRNPVLQSFENDEDILRVVNLVTMEDVPEDQEHNRDMFKNTKNIIIRAI